MSIPGLPFLWPILFKPTQRLSLPATRQLRKQVPRLCPKAGFKTSVKHRRPEQAGQRYGTAIPPLDLPPAIMGRMPPAVRETLVQKAPPKPVSALDKEKSAQSSTNAVEEKKPKDTASDKLLNAESTKSAPSQQDRMDRRADDPATAPQSKATGAKEALTSILSIRPPTSENTAAHKPPHLEAPPYVHHFDTYTLVKNLENGGFSEEQAVTTMKAVRSILGVNMDLARDGLVSKGDAEMETYLFKAASSELRTEIRTLRTTSKQKSRTELDHLQHSVDTLSQNISQQTASLKDELKGMFDDRKMAVRIERRDQENKIQELNYKITVTLNSEMRSQVEGLRWVLTRRTAFAILGIAVMTLGALRYSKYMERRNAMDGARLEKLGLGGDGGGGGGSGDGVAGFSSAGGDAIRRIENVDSAGLLGLG